MLATGLEDRLIATAGLDNEVRMNLKMHFQKQIILMNLPHPLRL